jgi:predicted phosphodiesterase
MRIQLVSDLHFECHADGGQSFIESLDPGRCDVLVLAGDVCTVEGGLLTALTMFSQRFKQVVYVAGNHEYWRVNRGSLNATLRKAAERCPNLHVLDNDILMLDGHRFLGTTLWFPDTSLARQQSPVWADFIAIPNLWKWVYLHNERSQQFLRRELREGDIVVTHHMPSWRCVHPQYAAESTNCYYVCDMEELIVERRPALWLHGHTHTSGDSLVGSTRIVCNPFGYVPSMLNSRFSDELVIDVV